MGLLQSISLYLGLSIIIVILLFAAGVILFVLANRKKASMSEVYYDSFDKHDTMEYLKFDEIISSDPKEPLKGAGVMVINQRTFVAALNVVGYNFFTASYDTQVNTINATISLFDSLENPISLRQTVKAINISHNIEVFEKEAARIEKEINEATRDKQILLDDAADYIDTDPDRAESYMDDAQMRQLEIDRKTRQLAEAREMIRYMRRISTDSGDTQKVQTLLYSYVYDNTKFTTQLSKEEIYMQAMSELENTASSLISNLYRCGCTARRCSAEELVDLMRRHMHPATGDDYQISELFHSDLGALFVTSDSLLQTVKEQMEQDAYRARLDEMYEQIHEAEKRMKLQAERADEDRLAKTRAMAQPMIHIETE